MSNRLGVEFLSIFLLSVQAFAGESKVSSLDVKLVSFIPTKGDLQVNLIHCENQQRVTPVPGPTSFTSICKKQIDIESFRKATLHQFDYLSGKYTGDLGSPAQNPGGDPQEPFHNSYVYEYAQKDDSKNSLFLTIEIGAFSSNSTEDQHKEYLKKTLDSYNDGVTTDKRKTIVYLDRLTWWPFDAKTDKQQ